MKDCPEKWADKRFKENDKFFHVELRRLLVQLSNYPQKAGHFQGFFFVPSDPKSEKKSLKSANKKKSGLMQTWFEANVPQGLLHR